MKFKLLSLAVGVSLIAAGLAHADAPKVYGRFDAALQNTNKESTTAKNQWELLNNNSRFGFKGSEQIDEDTSYSYQLEWGVDPADNDKASTDNITARNQFVTLHYNPVGEVQLGRFDTPLKTAQGKVDQFNDHAGDIKNLFTSGSGGEVRQNNAVAYRSNKLLGEVLQATVMVSPGEKVDVDGNGVADENGIADSYSASVVATKDNWYGAIAIDSSIQKWDHVRVVGGVDLGSLQLGAIYQQGQESKSGSVSEDNGYFLSGGYSINEYLLKAQWGNYTIDSAAGATTTNRTLLALGVEKKLSKQAKIYAEYVNVNEDKADTSDVYLSLGTQVNF